MEGGRISEMKAREQKLKDRHTLVQAQVGESRRKARAISGAKRQFFL